MKVLKESISTYSTDAYYGQVYMVKDYMLDNKVVGRLQYSVYDDSPHIQMIEVLPEYRRQGIAKQLLQDMQKDFPNTPIHTGMTTPDGTNLIDKVTTTVPNDRYESKKSLYDKVCRKLDDIDKGWQELWTEADNIGDDETLLDEWRIRMLKYEDKVQVMQDTLEDKKRQLEDELYDMPRTHTFVKMDEGFYTKDKYGYDAYTPTKDSHYQKLLKKPLNTLIAEDVRYINGIENARYMSLSKWYNNVDDSVNDMKFDMEDYQECAEWLQSLHFPLTIYRAVYDSTELDTISGKNHDICWSTNINIYKDSTSKFRNAQRIVRATIDQKIINIPLTISRFLYYTGKWNTQGFGEYEINLKPNFKNSDLLNLEFIDKNNVNESVNKIYYRGTVKGGKRSSTGNDMWDSNLFCSKNLKDAKLYGDDIEIIKPKDTAKILTQGTPDFNKLHIRQRRNESLLDYCVRVISKAKELGYDIVEFDRQGEIGTVILNTNAVIRNYDSINESFQKLDNDVFVTDYVGDVVNLIINKPKEYRIIYDKNKDFYIIGAALSGTHDDLLWLTYSNYYYPEFNSKSEFRKYKSDSDDNHTLTRLVSIPIDYTNDWFKNGNATYLCAGICTISCVDWFRSLPKDCAELFNALGNPSKIYKE